MRQSLQQLIPFEPTMHGEFTRHCRNRLLAEARRQLEDLIGGRGGKLGIVAHVLFMLHLFRALPNTAVNPVRAAAKAALKDVAARAAAIDIDRGVLRKKPRQ